MIGTDIEQEAQTVTAEAEMTTSQPPTPRCWCCDGEFAEVSLVRLGARPEVTICLDCARFLNRRPLARRHAHLWGAALHRVDRFLP